jgi:protein SCO1/2
MKRRTLTLTLGMLAVASGQRSPALAHSVRDVESRLTNREQYFQPIANEPAPDFALQDAHGQAVRLVDLRGKIVVLHFVYASCPDVCPLHTERIAVIQRMVNETPGRDMVRFISITTDPVRDTPAVMQEYGAAHGLDPINWSFLTSGPDRSEETIRLARAYGLVFVPTPEGAQMHGVVTYVIDGEGQLRAKFHGLDFDPTSLVVYLNALTHQEASGGHAPSPRPAAAPPQGLWQRFRSLF